MTTTSKNIFKDAAHSLVQSELDKTKIIQNQRYPDFIKSKCKQIDKYLKSELDFVLDDFDLLTFRKCLKGISELLDYFLASNQDNAPMWALELIKECYEKCGIKHQERDILIIHYQTQEYSVIPNMLRLLPPKLRTLNDPKRPIDLFFIPLEAKYDLASIALLGHEVGHIYWNLKYEDLKKVVKRKLDKEFGSETIFDPEELRIKRDKIASYIEEFLCDKIGRYLLGPAFDFALMKLLMPSLHNDVYRSNSHPNQPIRILRSFESLKSFAVITKHKECLKNVIDYFPEFESIDEKDEDEEFAERLAESINSIAKFPPKNDDFLDDSCNLVFPELNSFRPPFETVSIASPQSITPIEATIACCIYYYGEQFKSSNDYYVNSNTSNKEKLEVIRDKLIEHLRYAISLYDFVKRSQEARCGENLDVTILAKTLWQMRDREEGVFVITPSTDPITQYSATSVDLRLGNWFLVSKTTGYTHIRPNPNGTNPNTNAPLEAFYNNHFIPVGGEFILHPHQFVLAATLEYISVPGDYYALVLGRSSWGRLGLNIATATTVNSGFRGCITLELRNLGETPLPLNVGLRIAQLCLVKVPITSPNKGYFASNSKYIGPIMPEVPKIKGDADWKLLSLFTK